MKSTKSLNVINRRRLMKRPPTFNKIPTRGHVNRYSNWEVDIDWNHINLLKNQKSLILIEGLDGAVLAGVLDSLLGLPVFLDAS